MEWVINNCYSAPWHHVGDGVINISIDSVTYILIGMQISMYGTLACAYHDGLDPYPAAAGRSAETPSRKTEEQLVTAYAYVF